MPRRHAGFAGGRRHGTMGARKRAHTEIDVDGMNMDQFAYRERKNKSPTPKRQRKSDTNNVVNPHFIPPTPGPLRRGVRPDLFNHCPDGHRFKKSSETLRDYLKVFKQAKNMILPSNCSNCKKKLILSKFFYVCTQCHKSIACKKCAKALTIILNANIIQRRNLELNDLSEVSSNELVAKDDEKKEIESVSTAGNNNNMVMENEVNVVEVVNVVNVENVESVENDNEDDNNNNNNKQVDIIMQENEKDIINLTNDNEVDNKVVESMDVDNNKD